ncbi:zinc finger CCCH domain-containing 11A isoform X1 [Solea senegalensis]|uniref:Zinc finger CCCH domain-containing 11A isoform X1 n=1 Tax=Solea senegalensis TaxID=28829 RepID=A0AAV6QPY8_SOLSE|nr:zinc finger CCCH domain-containing protein 11A [Solea senegalensis]KAG7495218.1 zinc finger CCCH domain-containing 11A isoform X1 [Solea senegalensis]
MTNHGDDCYFFYYSTCSKGDSCPFRHCEAAMGNETVCNLWQEGRCFRSICKFRHMEITKNRKEIPCYWENQPAGCQKSHCAFFHERARYIDGMFVPADKSLIKREEQPAEEQAPPPTATLTTAANPQLRGVIKTENQEPVPSPTHPPVVINPADDDEDEDDQFSEEGDDGKGGPSPRKQPKSGDSLNFGVSTLEEIRLRKALKASMKKAGYPIQSSDLRANGEKENLQSFFRPAVYESREALEETRKSRGSVAERLGSVKGGEGVSLKRSLAERLGKVVDEEEKAPKKALKDRLGLSAALDEPDAAESSTESKKESKRIRIKTLEEIKQEKAAKSQNQTDEPSCPESTKTVTTKASKGVKRAITVKDDSISRVKTFSEILQAKKKREQEQQENRSILKKAKHREDNAPGKSQVKPDTTGPGAESTNALEVRVKTLEEIRQEKAARIQAQKAMETENKTHPDSEENGVKKPRLLRINKPASNSSDTIEKSVEVPEEGAAPQISPARRNVKVKTFEEIMREKRLRKQEMEEQEKASTETTLKQTADGGLKRKVDCLTSPGSLSPSSTTPTPDTTPSNQKLPVRKLIPLKAKDASPLNSTTSPGATVAAVAVVTSVPIKRSSSPQEQEFHSQSPRSSREVPDKNTRNSTGLSPSKQAATADNLRKSPEHTIDTKVRPKLNVRPSVVKPAVHVKPGQKGRGTERSAVAAVKPLNSSCTKMEEPLQETASNEVQVFPSSSAEAQLSSTVPRSPSTLLDSTSSPLREELQTVPVFSQSPSQETKSTVSASSSGEACAVPQSLVQKTPSQPKVRRQSTSVSRTLSTSALSSSSAMDDFEQLMNEFTDDHLEEDVDPSIGEDDLLQELSEMIDS